MQMENSLLERMPFPYFIIENDLSIVGSSKTAEQYFSPSDSFLSLIGQPQKRILEEFLNDTSEQNNLELKMYVKGQKLELFHVYKQKLKETETHLFCIPKEPYSSEVNKILDHVENKISTINNDFKANKVYFAQTVNEIMEAAIHSDQLATIGQLAAGVAHEIKNPLTTVKGFIQLIQPYLSEIGKEDYAVIALDEINRANEILHEFLSAAKPQSNKKQIINIHKLLKDIMILYEGEALFRNLDFRMTCACDQALLYVDVKQIKQVLVNIIKNAIEAIEEKNSNEIGTIRIRTNTNKESCIIEIADNGIGMKEETVEKLFVPFFSTKDSGTGIGTTVCKKIIEDHKGKISVSSMLESGTTFRIELPLYKV